jgi:hypothetical protein
MPSFPAGKGRWRGREMTDELRRIAGEIAEEAAMPFADIYTAMHTAMVASKLAYGEAYHVADNDGVLPRANGHLVMAYGFL